MTPVNQFDFQQKEYPTNLLLTITTVSVVAVAQGSVVEWSHYLYLFAVFLNVYNQKGWQRSDTEKTIKSGREQNLN